MTVYRVLAGVYRGHRKGELFEATLDPPAEARAVARGAIEVVERSTAKVRKGSYRLPKQTKKRKRAADAAEEGADAHTDTDQGSGRDGT